MLKTPCLPKHVDYKYNAFLCIGTYLQSGNEESDMWKKPTRRDQARLTLV